MENKKNVVAIVILTVLIVALIAVVYLYSDFNAKQMELLTQQANKILEADLIEDNIDFEIKTEKDYAKVEKSIKEYMVKLKNIYVEAEEMVSKINPNSIFSVENMQDKNLDEVQNIINDYKEKSQNLIKEYEGLISENNIKENFDKIEIPVRKEYYSNLYSEVMLSDVMKKQYSKLEEEIKNEKGSLYEKLNKIEKIKIFLEENEDSWQIKENKIQFTNLNRMTEYYNLLNQVIE